MGTHGQYTLELKVEQHGIKRGKRFFLTDEFDIANLHSKIFEILKFVFLSEVAHKSFCVKFSDLISKLKILEKSHSSPRIFN